MRIRSAWIAGLLSALLLVSTGVHLAHSHSHTHEANAGASIHPDCTLCHFHAPVVGAKHAPGHHVDPGATALLHLFTPDVATERDDVDTGAPRAPPRPLAN